MPLGDFTPLPQHTPDEDGLETIRVIAHTLANYWSFHEVAIADPFEAEAQVERAGEMLMAIVGWPKGWVISTWVDE